MPQHQSSYSTPFALGASVAAINIREGGHALKLKHLPLTPFGVGWDMLSTHTVVVEAAAALLLTIIIIVVSFGVIK